MTTKHYRITDLLRRLIFQNYNRILVAIFLTVGSMFFFALVELGLPTVNETFVMSVFTVAVSDLYKDASTRVFSSDGFDDFAQMTIDPVRQQLIVGAR